MLFLRWCDRYFLKKIVIARQQGEGHISTLFIKKEQNQFFRKKTSSIKVSDTAHFRKDPIINAIKRILRRIFQRY